MVNQQELFIYLSEKKNLIESKIKEIFPREENYGKRVLDAAYYSVIAGGKRIRPILCLMGYEIFKEDSQKILIFACGLEFIHTYSLIHDDLPCMDDDDYRRGKPSCHIAFDEATAILAGDGLQALAFECFTHPELIEKVNPLNLLKAINYIARAIGLRGMVAGQMADLLAEGKRGDLACLEWIHRHKTVDFLEASLVSGAILGEAKSEDLDILARFGQKLGSLFQIVDDLLDLLGDEKTLGKPIKSDLKKEKLTYPSLLGIEKTQELAQKIANEAIELLKPLKEKGELLKALTYYILNRAH